MNQKRAIGVVLVISMLLAYLQVPAVADINKKAKSFPGARRGCGCGT